MNEGTITWLPIEDAPRDGKPILIQYRYSLFKKYDRVSYCIAFWHPEHSKWIITPQPIPEVIIPESDMLCFAYINPPEVHDV